MFISNGGGRKNFRSSINILCNLSGCLCMFVTSAVMCKEQGRLPQDRLEA